MCKSKALAAWVVLFSLLGILNGQVNAQMRITEWMYNGLGTGSVGEYVEFTNMGASVIDMTGWSFDDDTRTPGSQSLTGFGNVQPGESVVFTDDTAANFRSRWGLPGFIKIIGSNTNNISRMDEINLYDGLSPTLNLVDRLTYNDPGNTPAGTGPRTTAHAGGPNSDAVLGINDCSQWALISLSTFAGDPHHVGATQNGTGAGEIGNPGYYLVPEPASLGLICTVGLIFIRRRRA